MRSGWPGQQQGSHRHSHITSFKLSTSQGGERRVAPAAPCCMCSVWAWPGGRGERRGQSDVLT
ncbi:hypothetical protein E2C01_072741 [Portunus trituberculatus]|uniref:Uncharacterized protein n=1 Tax=Portunus trituberculatus TaxID=210409 RepID=A0A5B7I8N5_PORTR|nr:hypothetical protein [Portunus trituberculatus]